MKWKTENCLNHFNIMNTNIYKLGPLFPNYINILFYLYGLGSHIYTLVFLRTSTYNWNAVVNRKLTRKGINFNFTNCDNFRGARISDVNVSSRCCRLAEKSPFFVCRKTNVLGTNMIVCSSINSWISLKSKQMSISYLRIRH